MTVFTPGNKSGQIKTAAQIKEGEQVTGADQIADVLALAADRATRYAQSVPERRVSPSAEAVAALSQFHEKFPDHSTPPGEVIALLERAGWNVEDDGLFGAPPVDVVVGEEVHASLQKALRLGGFGCKRVTVVEADEQGRMRAEKLPAISERSIVCIQAGNVNSGAFDPAAEICGRARAAGAWVHVDGAFGLWAGVSPKYAELTRGFEQADSWATDAHKWLNVGYDSGIVMVRNGMALRRAMTISAAYLHAGSLREPMNHVPEASRRARGIELWAAMKSLGWDGLRD